MTIGNSALRKSKGGRYVAKGSDVLLRVFAVPVHGGQSILPFEVLARARSFPLAQTRSGILQIPAIRHSCARSGQELLDASGREVPFLTDLDELERQGDLHMLSYESIYAKR